MLDTTHRVLLARVFDLVSILVTSWVENCTIIVKISTRSKVMRPILRRQNMEVNRMLLKVGRSLDSKSFGILHRNDVSLSDMEMEVVGLGAECDVFALFEDSAGVRFVDDVAPVSGWEVEVCGVLSNLIG